jgi:uncharacterized protein
MRRSASGLAAGMAMAIVLAASASPTEQPLAATPVDCESGRKESERSACAARDLAAVQAEHRRAFESCKATLSGFLGRQLVAQEEAWHRDLSTECAESDTACLIVANRERDTAIHTAFPQCGGSGEPQAMVSGSDGRATTGMLPASWTPPDGPGQEVPFSFEAESATAGTMSTTLGPGGEHFHGTYVRLEKSTQGHLVTAVFNGWSSPEWEVWEHDSDGHWTATDVSYGEFARFYTGKVLATLRGSEGSAMRCQMILKAPQKGLLGGGSGSCQISDGGRIALDF